MTKRQSYIAFLILVFLSGIVFNNIWLMILPIFVFGFFYYIRSRGTGNRSEIGYVSNPGKKHGNFIYVWKDKEDDRYYKIGRTNNPYRRLKTFQTAQPKPIEVVGVLAVKNDEKAEKIIHEKFANIRVRDNGEWFYAKNDLKRYVSSIRDNVLTEDISSYISR